MLIGLSLIKANGAKRYFLGIASIVAAIKYTVGSNAYGYRAIWPIRLFAGGVSVWLNTPNKSLRFQVDLPATATGFECGCAQFEQLRDMENDRHSNKITLPILLGFDGGKRYHYVLFITALLTSLGLSFAAYYHISFPLFAFAAPLGKAPATGESISRRQRPWPWTQSGGLECFFLRSSLCSRIFTQLMKAEYRQHILNLKRPSGTSRGILRTKETWFILLQEAGKFGMGSVAYCAAWAWTTAPIMKKN